MAPDGTKEQVPSEPAIAHDLHVVLQPLSQHLPWAQNPDSQSAAAAQSVPRGFLPHEPATQLLAPTQSAAAAQEVLHFPFVSQT